MSECEKYLDMISAMADGELSDSEKAELMAHARSCAECASLIELYGEISLAMAEDMAEPPAELCENVMHKVRSVKIKKKTSAARIAAKYLASAACVALILFALLRMPGIGCASSGSDAAMENMFADAEAPAASAPKENASSTTGSAADDSKAEAEDIGGLFDSADGSAANDAAPMEPAVDVPSSDDNGVFEVYHTMFYSASVECEYLPAAAVEEGDSLTVYTAVPYDGDVQLKAEEFVKMCGYSMSDVSVSSKTTSPSGTEVELRLNGLTVRSSSDGITAVYESAASLIDVIHTDSVLTAAAACAGITEPAVLTRIDHGSGEIKCLIYQEASTVEEALYNTVSHSVEITAKGGVMTIVIKPEARAYGKYTAVTSEKAETEVCARYGLEEDDVIVLVSMVLSGEVSPERYVPCWVFVLQDGTEYIYPAVELG